MSIFSGIGKFLGSAAGSSTIGALGSLAGGLLGGVFGKSATNANNRAQLQLAEYQYSKQLEQWNRQNEYNSPKAQMQRYKEAGLNPNLIYSQGSNGNAASSPEYSAPTLQSGAQYSSAAAGSIGGAIGTYQNLANLQQQINESNARISNLNAQATYTKARALTEYWNKFIAEYKAGSLKIANNYLDKYYDLRNSNMNQDLINKQIQNQVLGKQISMLEEQIYKAKRENRIEDAMGYQMYAASLRGQQLSNSLSQQQYSFNIENNPWLIGFSRQRYKQMRYTSEWYMGRNMPLGANPGSAYYIGSSIPSIFD